MVHTIDEGKTDAALSELTAIMHHFHGMVVAQRELLMILARMLPSDQEQKFSAAAMDAMSEMVKVAEGMSNKNDEFIAGFKEISNHLQALIENRNQ